LFHYLLISNVQLVAMNTRTKKQIKTLLIELLYKIYVHRRYSTKQITTTINGKKSNSKTFFKDIVAQSTLWLFIKKHIFHTLFPGGIFFYVSLKKNG